MFFLAMSRPAGRRQRIRPAGRGAGTMTTRWASSRNCTVTREVVWAPIVSLCTCLCLVILSVPRINSWVQSQEGLLPEILPEDVLVFFLNSLPPPLRIVDNLLGWRVAPLIWSSFCCCCCCCCCCHSYSPPTTWFRRNSNRSRDVVQRRCLGVLAASACFRGAGG